MSGQYNGLQVKILVQDLQALIFGNLEKIFTIITGSKARSAFFKEKQLELYPKQQI